MNGGSKSTNIQITAIAINGPRLEIEFHFFLLMCEMHFGDFFFWPNLDSIHEKNTTRPH